MYRRKAWIVVIALALVIVAVLLFMLRATGMKVHIAVSVIGLVLLIAYTIATKKEWKKPALEILQRVCYGIALITGVVLMNVHGVVAVSIIHKISAVLFVVLLACVEIHKTIKR
jgi:4-hydroxybenzoate polyprenyltransferase